MTAHSLRGGAVSWRGRLIYWRTVKRGSFLLASIVLLLAALSACGGGGGGSEALPFGLESEVIATGGSANTANGMTFAPDGRLFYGEQYEGTILIVNADGTLQPTPFAQLTVADYLQLDWGLTGLALDPDFEDNGYVYAFYMEPAGDAASGNPLAQPKLVRFTDDNGIGTDQTLISDDFPVTDAVHPGYNGGGGIGFGPDGHLYIAIGDYDIKPEEGTTAQDLSTPIGKMLRVDKETGEAPDDNPFVDDEDADPRVYAYGFREPFDFTFDADSGTLYGTDNTPNTCEELNVIEAGGNYSWPDVGDFPFADCAAGEGIQAIYHLAREGTEPESFLSLVEVSGLEFLQGSTYGQLTDGLMVCEGQASVVNDKRSPGVLRRLTLSSPEQVTASDIIVRDCKGDVAVSPDGVIYYSNATEIRRLIDKPAGDDDEGQVVPSR